MVEDTKRDPRWWYNYPSTFGQRQDHAIITSWRPISVANIRHDWESELQTCRKQTVPGSVLLGFLPIISEMADDSKARVYHAAMELILKRK